MTDPLNPHSFFGLPIIVDPLMPKDEVWMITQGKSVTVHVHEGPQTGEDIEVWLKQPRVHRIVNLGEWTKIPKVEFKL